MDWRRSPGTVPRNTGSFAAPFRLMRRGISVAAKRILAGIPVAEFEDVAVIGQPDRVRAARAPLDQVEETAVGLDLGDVVGRMVFSASGPTSQVTPATLLDVTTCPPE
jgi:hypothetical protein